MKHSIGFGAFATFGNPSGFQQLFDEGIRFSPSLDLNSSAIELNPDSEIFAVKKDLSGSDYSLCFCIYTYARETQSSRSGTFIGSCIVFENCTSEGTYIYECLRELHEDIISNPRNIADDVLQVNQAKDLEVKKPHRYETLKANKLTLSKPQFINNQESYLIAAPHSYKSELAPKVSDFFSAAVKEFPQIGTLYFTTNQKVIEYVQSRGLIKVIPFGQFREHKSSQRSPAKQRIEINLDAPRPVYKEPQQNMSIRTWGMDWPVSELSRRVEEHNTLATLYRELEAKHNELLNRENPGAYESLRLLSNNRDSRLKNVSESRIIKFVKDNIIWAVLSFLLIVALIIWGAYSYFNPTTEKTQPSRSTTQSALKDPAPTNTLKVLSPPPTGYLDSEALEYLNDRLKMEMSFKEMLASEVADLAIKLNPRDIGRRYEFQREAYTEKLVDLNRECFNRDNKDPKLVRYELKYVPVYKGF